MKLTGWPTTSRQSRGYDAQWDKVRRTVLQRDCGLCQCAQCQGGRLRIASATEVHHIIARADGGTNEMDNLQAINTACHKRETAAAQGRTIRPAIVIGIDGYPLSG